ncbi:SHOCT domain-containing protein [Frankia sp. CcWB3]
MDYPLLNAFLTVLFIFLFAVWIYFLFVIYADIFRSRDLSGWGKAGWSIFVLVLPVIGILSYLIVRGDGMQDRMVLHKQYEEEAVRGYLRAATRTTSIADELAKLDDLHRRGLLNDQEFERERARILA